MREVKERKKFVEPELTKSKEPLDRVTFGEEKVLSVNVSEDNKEESMKTIKEDDRKVGKSKD